MGFSLYAGPSSVSGGHPQQYYLIQFCTGAVHGAFTASDISPLLRKSLFPDFFFPRNKFVPRITPQNSILISPQKSISAKDNPKHAIGSAKETEETFISAEEP